MALPLHQVQDQEGLQEGPQEGHQQGLQEGPQEGPVHKMRKVGQFSQDHWTTADRAAREQFAHDHVEDQEGSQHGPEEREAHADERDQENHEEEEQGGQILLQSDQGYEEPGSQNM